MQDTAQGVICHGRHKQCRGCNDCQQCTAEGPEAHAGSCLCKARAVPWHAHSTPIWPATPSRACPFAPSWAHRAWPSWPAGSCSCHGAKSRWHFHWCLPSTAIPIWLVDRWSQCRDARCVIALHTTIPISKLCYTGLLRITLVTVACNYLYRL